MRGFGSYHYLHKLLNPSSKSYKCTQCTEYELRSLPENQTAEDIKELLKKEGMPEFTVGVPAVEKDAAGDEGEGVGKSEGGQVNINVIEDEKPDGITEDQAGIDSAAELKDTNAVMTSESEPQSSHVNPTTTNPPSIVQNTTTVTTPGQTPPPPQTEINQDKLLMGLFAVAVFMCSRMAIVRGWV